MDVHSIKAACDSGLVPIVYGDVAFDDARGGTIISTEEILGFLAPIFKPKYFLLAGETEGVLDAYGNTIPVIDRDNFSQISSQLGESRGTDVTGGMSTKVYQMLELVDEVPGLKARIFSLGPNKIKIRRENFWEADLSGADVVFCYLYPDVMKKLAAKLAAGLKPGTIVVSSNFSLPGFVPSKVLRLEGSWHNDPVYIYHLN